MLECDLKLVSQAVLLTNAHHKCMCASTHDTIIHPEAQDVQGIHVELSLPVYQVS